MEAAQYGRSLVVREMILAGADVLHKNKYCMNSLQVRATRRSAALAQPLWPAAAFARCIPTGLHGSTRIVWVSLTPFLGVSSPASTTARATATAAWRRHHATLRISVSEWLSVVRQRRQWRGDSTTLRYA